MAGILKVDRIQSDINLSFAVAGSNVAYMNSTGLQMTGGTLSLGGTTVIPAVGQIAFPATQSASSDANTLDDYEEGTWTPTFSSSSGTITTYSGTGNYIKIGRMVYLWCAILVSNKGTASGNGTWGGAPFTSISNFVVSGNRTAIFVVREDFNTGTMYQGLMNTSSAGGLFVTTTNGTLTWTNGDIWIFSFGYETTA
jgi:hypothetical protein